MLTDMPHSLPAPKPNHARTAYESLREMLLRGVLPGGSILQERLLAEKLGLSRTPVREALNRLAGEGLVESEDRFLRVVSIGVPDAMEILSVRQMLEGEATRLACARISPQTIAGIRAMIIGMGDPAATSDDAHWQADDLLHLTIAEASGNTLLRRLVSELRQRTRLFGLRRIPARFHAGKEEHLGILQALEEGLPDLAAQRMRDHIANARLAILATLSEGF